MFENQITEEVIRYLKDDSYQYAILIDGEWGCGKTYFVKHSLSDKIKEFEQNSSKRTIKYISLYGCKTIQDIQEAIVWGFAVEASKYVTSKTVKLTNPVAGNILTTSKRVLNGVREKFLPDVKICDIASDWILMKDYIFIFDDLERCDCPINELFGFINGLVEHEGTKVILIANEKEISIKEINAQKEFQYLVALDDKIEWKEKSQRNSNYTHNTINNKVNISELEEKRKILFDDEEYDSTYKKIREKLIGITLFYQPYVKEICRHLITNISLDNELAKELEAHVDIFCNYMDQYSHHNLRTFQFFISKISYLFLKLSGISIDKEYYDQVRSFLIQDCFIWSIEYKSEYKLPTDEWQKINYNARPKSPAVKKYVENGEFISEEFVSDINKYITEQLRNKLSNDDPVNLLYSGYYWHSQKWCEEQLDSIKKKLINNRYPVFAYQKIIITLQTLIDIGFDSNYLDEFMNIMLNNVDKSENVDRIDTDLFFIENRVFKEKVLARLRELNNAIAEKNNLEKEKSISDILNSPNWADELQTYVSEHKMHYNPDSVLFSKAPTDIWITNIANSSAADIDMFRHILHSLYPTDSIRHVTCFDDIPVLEKIWEAITPEKSEDLIVRAILGWLKNQIESIINLYQNR